jgi:2-keto-4-pentenoate hydratase/2-oxohepta-3-ene-1,7-dioic acid hydratase in catechol pathway
MKIVRYREGDRIHYGILEAGGLIRRLEGTPFESLTPDGTSTQWASVRLLSPVPAPRIFGLGLNYADHAAEGGKEHPPQPMLFMKPSTSAIGPEEPIIYPAEERDLVVHFEAELVAVIGTKARRVSVSEALDHVLGYTCGNDVSERVIQKAEMANGCLLIGKGFDTFKPLGPWIATGLDPSDLQLTTRLNGQVVQSTSTADLIFTVGELIEYLSAAVTLLPGDVIMTGTPSGVGEVQPGDVVEIEIEGIGMLRNPVAAEPG